MKMPIVIAKIAKPGTCWWSNTSRNQRMDTLFGITRTFMRKDKKYIYRLTLGRFTIGVMF